MAKQSATFKVEFIDAANSRVTLVVGQAADVGDQGPELDARVEKEPVQFETSPIIVTVPSVDGIAVGQLVTLSVNF